MLCSVEENRRVFPNVDEEAMLTAAGAAVEEQEGTLGGVDVVV